MATVELSEYGTLELVKYGQYQPSTSKVVLRIQGNSILSTIFISSLDAGASLTIQYYEERQGVRRNLQSHTMTEAGTSTIVVGPHVETPFAEIVVANGQVEYTATVTARVDQPFDMTTYASIVGDSEFTDDPALAVRTVEMGPLVRADYDEIEAVEIDSTTEDYVYKLAGNEVARLQFKFKTDGSFESVKRL